MKVLITRPHTHASTHYIPGPDGLELDLPPHAVDYIERAGAGKRVHQRRRRMRDVIHDEVDKFNPGLEADPESDIPDPEQ